MALIKCPECGREISNRAVACPTCGLPREHFYMNVSEPVAEPVRETVSENNILTHSIAPAAASTAATGGSLRVKCPVCGTEYVGRAGYKCPDCSYPLLHFTRNTDTVDALIYKAKKEKGLIQEIKTLSDVRMAMWLKLRELSELNEQGAALNETAGSSFLRDTAEAVKMFRSILINHFDLAGELDAFLMDSFDSEEELDALIAYKDAKEKASQVRTNVSSASSYRTPPVTEQKKTAANSKYINAKVGDRIKYGKLGSFGKDVEWTVLANKGTEALIISNNILARMPFHDKNVSEIIWNMCSLREWMNHDLLDKLFSETEKKAIKETYLDNSVPYPDRFKVRASDGTTDKLFLLTKSDMEKYSVINKTESDWHLRSVSKGSPNKNFNNKLEEHYCTEISGVRPAMWVDLTQLR